MTAQALGATTVVQEKFDAAGALEAIERLLRRGGYLPTYITAAATSRLPNC